MTPTANSAQQSGARRYGKPPPSSLGGVSAKSLRIITPRGKLVIIAVVCSLFAATGIVTVALSPETMLNLIVGVAAVGFFGVGGGISLISLWRRSLILEADAEGIRFSHRTLIEWKGVERVGTTSTQLGIRLRNPDALIAQDPRGFSREELRETRRSSGGWDLVFAENLLDRTPSDAAAAINAQRP
nr:STM3941 family protein [Microbacterium endophyticum]